MLFLQHSCKEWWWWWWCMGKGVGRKGEVAVVETKREI